MTKKKKILIISLFGIILVGLVSAYVIYGSTLIDITNEKSINKYLSDDEKNSVTILAMDTYQEKGNLLSISFIKTDIGR